ncbi:MAG: hypothetical protein ABJA34_06775 [Pseudonocardiales bacterium]
MVVVLAAAAVGRATFAGASPALPRQSAAQLLAKVSRAHVEQLSGTVKTSSHLGLPSLPGVAGGDLSPQSLLSGDHTLRIYLDGADRQRVDLLGTLAGSSLVHNGADLWSWSSSTNKATHTTLPAHPSRTGEQPAGKKPGTQELPDLAPQALAQHVLDTVGPTTTVSVGDPASVAGRSAYDLRIAPKTSDSLVKAVDVFVDSATGLPLRVTVLARGAKQPAIDVGFTSVRFAKPAGSLFAFKPPRGAKLTEGAGPRALGTFRARGKPSAAANGHAFLAPGRRIASPGTQRPQVLGTGWVSVVEIRGVPGGLLADKRLQALLQGTRTVKGSFGSGHVLTTALVSALITDGGLVFVGAVTPEALVRIADTAR